VLSQVEEPEAGSTVARSNAGAGANTAGPGDPPSERPPTLSVPHTASQLVVPAGALKYKKPAATKTVAMAEGFQALAAQRAAADAKKESARMVTAQANKELVKDKVRLSEKTFALEERRVLQETLDKEADRAHRREDNLKNLVLDLQRAGISMQDYLAARQVFLTSSNSGHAAPNGGGTAASAAGAADEANLGDIRGLGPPTRAGGQGADGVGSDDGEGPP